MNAPDWFRPRRYLHFDLPLSEANAVALATNPERVARHGFYPFLRFIKSTPKIRRDKATDRLLTKKKERDLSYCAHADAQIFAHYSYRLAAAYEAEVARRGLDSVVLAFRKGKGSNVDFANAAFKEIARRGNCQAIALDISSFFDNLDHALLKRAWAALLGASDGKLPPDHYQVFCAVTRHAWVSLADLKERLNVSRRWRQSKAHRLCDPDFFREQVRGSGLININHDPKGIPQGSPISALLSNLYMLEFDTWLQSEVKHIDGRYMRYCDDLLVIVNEEDAAAIEQALKERIAHQEHLEIQASKTQSSTFHIDATTGELGTEDPLQYLGFTYDGVRMLIRPGSIARYNARMTRGVRVAIATMQKRNTARAARGAAPRPLFLKKLYARFTPLGRRNFPTYGYGAGRKMQSVAIRRQLKRYLPRLQRKIADASTL